MISRIQITKDKIMCYQQGVEKTVYLYDLVKHKNIDLGCIETDTNYVILENTIYYLNTDHNKIHIRYLKDNEKESIAVNWISSNSQIQVSPEGDIILLDHNGIHEFSNGGTMWETLIDGRECSVSKQDYHSDSFLLVSGENNTYYIHYYSQTNANDNFWAEYIFEKE